MWSASLILTSPDDSGELCSRLWDAGPTGIEETANGLCAYFNASVLPQTVRGLFPDFEITVNTDVAPVSVQECIDREPIFAGKRFVIVPAGSTEEIFAATSRITLPIDAAMAFGSGRHETTQLCLEALELCLHAGDTVFDVGCGSGILCLAAQKLGAGSVIGSDIERDSILVAQRHFSGPLFVGSADGFLPSAADLVISNITGSVNDHIAGDLQRILKLAGKLIISGFTDTTRPKSFHAGQVLHQGDWQCWICSRDAISPQVAGLDPNKHNAEWWL